MREKGRGQECGVRTVVIVEIHVVIIVDNCSWLFDHYSVLLRHLFLDAGSVRFPTQQLPRSLRLASRIQSPRKRLEARDFERLVFG